MSSSSGYLTELSSYNSDNSATEKGKNDLDPYKNSGAEQGMPEINAGYTDINDTAHQERSQTKRKRRLPEPPAFKPHQPRKNSTPWFQSCKELCSYCGHSRLILSITLSILAMDALGVVIYLVVTNIEGPEPTSTSPSTSTVTTTRNPPDACPYEAVFELNYGGVLVCELKVVGSTTLSFDKVNGTNIKPILYQTGIRIPDNVPERGRFSATWKPDGTLITNINFSPVQCHDEGNYSLTVTSHAGTKVHYIYVKVIDYPKEPTLCIQRGLIGGKESKLQCQASTGCNKANLTVEATEQNRQDYNPWAGNLTQQHYQEGYIWKTNVTLILTIYEVDNLLQNRSFRCTYFMGGTHYYSHRILIQIVPAAFCVIRKPKCLYPHPYDCNKFITCTTIPTETTCPPGQHFLNSTNCDGQCVYPAEAKCSIGESDVGYCEGT